MNKILILSICLSIFTTNCVERETHAVSDEETVAKETPLVFKEPKVVDKIGSYSSRYKSDIISELYLEALKKNLKLKTLDTQIQEISTMHEDSLKAYEKYEEMNSKYWSSVANLIRQISDSTTQQSAQEMFDGLESKYKISVGDLQAQKYTAEKYRKRLRDQQILIKLFVTAPMMVNFQKNEKPAIERLNSLIEEYDNLIMETEQYTHINK